MNQPFNGGKPRGGLSAKGCGCVVVFLFAAALVTVNALKSLDGPSAPVQGSAPSEAELTELRSMMAPQAGAQLRDGTAAMILVDVSGSMDGEVADADGSLRKKIEIARRSVADIVRQTEAFAAGHKDKVVLLGVSEFSSRKGQDFRTVVPLGPPSLAQAKPKIDAMYAEGGTPIGDSIIAAKQALNATGMRKQHILVVTDGENTEGRAPAPVTKALTGMPVEQSASLYFVAFDVDAAKFAAVREAGATVDSAANAKQLKETLDFLLSEKILLENE